MPVTAARLYVRRRYGPNLAEIRSDGRKILVEPRICRPHARRDRRSAVLPRLAQVRRSRPDPADPSPGISSGTSTRPGLWTALDFYASRHYESAISESRSGVGHHVPGQRGPRRPLPVAGGVTGVEPNWLLCAGQRSGALGARQWSGRPFLPAARAAWFGRRHRRSGRCAARAAEVSVLSCHDHESKRRLTRLHSGGRACRRARGVEL